MNLFPYMGRDDNLPLLWRSLRRHVAPMLVGLVLLASGCGGGSPDVEPSASTESDVPKIVVTTGIWSDIVANVACNGIADIETIIPVGGDPHGFEPSLRDRERMENSALVVANGMGLELRLSDTLEAVADSGTPVLEIAEWIPLIPFLADVAHDDEEDHPDEADVEVEDPLEEEDDHAGEHGEGGDPHVWFDPTRVSEVLGELALRLTDDAGIDGDAVAACLSGYREELARLDGEIEDLLEPVPPLDRKLVTNHDALGYFADRYGFEIIGTVVPSTAGLSETNPAQLEELAQTISREGVGAIFSETLHTASDAEALAARLGDVEVVTLYTGSLGPAGSGAETYVGFMRTNASLIADALG